MAKKKGPVLTEAELREISSRNDLIYVHRRTAELLESEKNLLISHLLTSKGLDPSKRWVIGKGGALTEEKPDG